MWNQCKDHNWRQHFLGSSDCLGRWNDSITCSRHCDSGKGLHCLNKLCCSFASFSQRSRRAGIALRNNQWLPIQRLSWSLLCDWQRLHPLKSTRIPPQQRQSLRQNLTWKQSPYRPQTYVKNKRRIIFTFLLSKVIQRLQLQSWYGWRWCKWSHSHQVSPCWNRHFHKWRSI